MWSVNRTRYFFLIFTAIIALEVQLANALDLPVRVSRLTIEDGLSQSTVYDIAQDRQGRIWLATGDGITVVDGTEISVFRNIPGDPTSLADNYVTAIEIADDGKVWLGSYGGGLNLYDPARQSFEQIDIDVGFSITDIFEIAFDPTGQVWVGTRNGAFLLNAQQNVVRVLSADAPDKADEIVAGSIRAIHVAPDGQVWFGSATGGISGLDPMSGQIRTFTKENSALSDNAINTIISLADETMLIGTEFGGLNQFDKDGNFHQIGQDSVNGIGDTDVTSIIEGSQGIVWLGTWSNGVVVWDRNDDSFRSIKRSLVNPRSLSSHTVKTLFLDRFETLWVGTFDAGANRFSATGDRFRHFVYDPLTPNSLINQTVWSFADNFDGKLWIGTRDGMSLLDPDAGTNVNYDGQSDLLSGLDNTDVRALLKNDDDLWIGTFNGLKRQNLKTGDFDIYRQNPDETAIGGLTNNRIRILLLDGENTLWVGTQDGLNKIDLVTKEVTQFLHRPNDSHSLPHPRIRALALSPSRQLMVGTSGGYSILEKDSENFVSFLPSDSTFNDGDIRALYFDNEDRLFIGSQKGIAIHDQGSESWSRIRQSDGLANDTIYKIIPAGKHLWVTTNNGLSSIDLNGMKIATYRYEHGLQSNEFNFNAGIITSNNYIALGGINGVTLFDPADFEAEINAVSPILNIQLIAVDIDGNTRALPESATPNIINSNERVIFSLKSTDTKNPILNRIELRTVQDDTDWVRSQSDRQRLEFAGLSQLFAPKQHSFELRAISSEGTKSEIRRIDIIAQPPLWSRPLFIVLSLVAIGSVIVLLVLPWIQKRQIKKNFALQKSASDQIIAEQKKSLASQEARLDQLLEFKRNHQSLREYSELDRQFIDSLDIQIQQNISNSDFNVTRLSSGLNISEQTLRRRMIELARCTPQEFIITSRIIKAQEMLRRGKTIKEVAFAVGYPDQSHFSRVFKRVVGQTPKVYLNENKK